MSEALHNNPEQDAKIIPFEAQRIERPLEPIAPIEYYLLSKTGQAEMTKVYDVVDGSAHITKALSFVIDETLETDEQSIYALLLDDTGKQGLAREELVELYSSNPLILATIRAANERALKGDLQAKKLYGMSLRVFMNMVRYERLTDEYDGADSIWDDRRKRLGVFAGIDMPSSLRAVYIKGITTSGDSPSDFLGNYPKD